MAAAFVYPDSITIMKTIFKIFFIFILLPIIILWKILRLIAPELTRPFDSLARGIGSLLRFN